jgi:hypothetical protein
MTTSVLRRAVFFAMTAFLAMAGSGRADELAVNGQMPGLTLRQNFPATKLRGYGTLSGHAYADAVGGSLLQITCQDAERARLVQAKYLSDLEELPPGTKPGQVEDGDAKISVRTADNLGAVAALREGTTVVLASASSVENLAKLLTGGLKGSPAQWTSVAEGAIPMYLDRFDKYGFRFYYGPGNLPTLPNGKVDPSYDTRKDFDFMQANHAGLLVWQTGARGVTPEWLTHEPFWDWTLAEAKLKGLPFGVNLGIESSAYWFYNRDPSSMMQFAPGFLGSYYGSMGFGEGDMVSWSSSVGQDALLGQLQTTVRHLVDTDNITSWLEPHEELGGGIADLLVDYGPRADASFRTFLQGKYKTIGAVAQRYDDKSLTSWDQLHVPEPASFLGWGDGAVDLAGTWKVNYEAADNPDALNPQFDDSTWGEMTGPGNGLARMLPAKPAIWRRHFSMDGGWLGKHPAVWLYVWDLNTVWKSEHAPEKAVVISVNGKVQKEARPDYSEHHWTAIDVTKAIQEGDNFLAVRLPRGIFNYRVYLSGDAPKSYPLLGEGRNARWVDFSDWLSYSRMSGVKRGMQMIRQVDPNRGIVLMAPDRYEDDILEDAIAYGGDFHNTGYMGGWWCDKLPALMRGAGLPFSTEPSQGPTLPPHILNSMALWITEGVNAIDHFQSLGEVLYHPDLKKTFEDHVAMYTSIGRYHAPTAQIAALYSNRINNLLGWPWEDHPAVAENGQPYFRGGSYPSAFQCRGLFSPTEYLPKGTSYESDAVTEKMLVRDQADKYRVIVDSDTAIMDEATIDGIERFVRNGGVFVTYGETGRHSPEKPDSWPINRLTGYQVTDEKPGSGTVSLDAGQKIFSSGVTFSGAMTGHHLNAVANDVTSLLNWNDGSTAAGLRPLGKGFVVTVGPWLNGANGNAFMSGLFQWLKIDPIPAHVETSGNIFWRHFVSNNGLYDVWVLWNRDGKAPTQGTLVLDPGLRPAWSVDLKTGARSAVIDGKLPVDLPPLEMAMLITPRAGIADSSSDWFTLQRGWWQGGDADLGAPLPKPAMKNAMDITDGWAFEPVDPKQANDSDLLGAMTDDRAWKKVSLGIFTLPDYPDCRHAVIRKHLHVPDAWTKGRVLVHMPGIHTGATYYLDGQPLKRDTVLAGGSDHILAVDMRSDEYLMGADGPGWLSYHPDPLSRQELNANFESSTDLLHWTGPVAVPGKIAPGTKALRADFIVSPAAAGKTVVMHAMEASAEVHGFVVNGRYLSPHVRDGSELNLNVTPWIIPGKKNEIVVVMGGSHETITDLSLEFHRKGTYP